MTTARLVFEDGNIFHGNVFASSGERQGEVVFNTAMSGYQEILTDPSYEGQMVVMTYPLIGNYGINDEDVESRQIFLEALLVREYIDFPSNYRSRKTLKQYLEEHHILGVEGLDTRAITRLLRDKGAQKAFLTTSNESEADLLKRLRDVPDMSGQNLVDSVTISKFYQWEDPSTTDKKYRVAVIDCGVKYNILRNLAKVGCDCKIFPATVSFEELMAEQPDGIFLSNGPGDPAPVTHVINTVKNLVGKVPIFGICLGQQILGLALGARTYKLKFGHHGANHPVKNLRTGKVEITSQNHGFCVDPESFPSSDYEVTHINLNDNTLAGFRHKTGYAFAVQYHPEAGPGPHDSSYLFQEFADLMKSFKETNAKKPSLRSSR